MKGRKPQSGTLRRLRGERPSRTRNAPDVPLSVPDAPEWLSEAARQHFDAIAPTLAEVGIVTELDADLLGNYCQTLARLAEAVAVLDGEGTYYTAQNGLIKRHPAAAVEGEARRALASLGAELGLSPTARERLNVQAVGDRGGKGRFFSDRDVIPFNPTEAQA